MSAEYLQENEVEERASRWILQRDRGELTLEDRAALEAWLSADSRHREAYLRLGELWRCAGELKVWRPADGEIQSDVLAARSRQQRPSRRPALAAAATVLLALGAGAVWYLQEPQDTYTTQIGGYQRLLLEDGSVLQLNTDSKLRVRFSAQGRKVELLRGETYFDIASDAQRPFDVIAGQTVVRALGTAFSVRLRDAERVNVLVTQGRVSVQEPDSPAKLAEAGQVAEAKPAGIRVGLVKQAEVERRLAWQSGMLHFQNEALAEVVAEFNRYNRRQLQITDPELATLTVGGSFKANNLESFVAAMRGMRGVRVEEGEETIRLLGSPP